MIKRSWYRGLAALFLVASSSFVQAEEPAKARARLGAIVGSWTIEGMEQAFAETCEWFDRNSHVVCTSEEKGADKVSRAVSILSFSEHSGTYAYYNYGSSGSVRALTGFNVDGNWLFTGERRTASGDTVRSQVRMSPMGEAVAFKEERSTNGGAWQTVAEFKYVRKVP
jgi:hypothetical protein